MIVCLLSRSACGLPSSRHSQPYKMGLRGSVGGLIAEGLGTLARARADQMQPNTFRCGHLMRLQLDLKT